MSSREVKSTDSHLGRQNRIAYLVLLLLLFEALFWRISQNMSHNEGVCPSSGTERRVIFAARCSPSALWGFFVSKRVLCVHRSPDQFLCALLYSHIKVMILMSGWSTVVTSAGHLNRFQKHVLTDSTSVLFTPSWNFSITLRYLWDSDILKYVHTETCWYVQTRPCWSWVLLASL